MTDDDHKPGSPPTSDRGVYGISVAAELSGIKEQSLRLYEREGLLTRRAARVVPAATAPTTWRASGAVRRREADGVNLTGIARILELEDRNDALDDRNVVLEEDNAALRAAETRPKSRKRRPAPPTGHQSASE